jgi:hypothetical protein
MALLPLTWLAPALFALRFVGAFGHGGEPGLVTLGMWAAVLLPLFAGAVVAQTLRPIGVLGWGWLGLNLVCGYLADGFVALMGFGT